MEKKYDLAVIGGGPAGLTAAVYARRAGLRVAVFSPQTPGSQLLKTNEIENFPGFPEGITGYDLLEKMQAQAEKFGAEIYDDAIIGISGKFPDFMLKTESGAEISSKTAIIAAGSVPRQLGLPSEKAFAGKGVSYCAVCDGFFFRNKDVAVVGGGDTALGDALYLSKFASKIYLVHRRHEFRAADYISSKVRENAKIELVLNSVVQEIKGNSSVSAIEVKNLIDGGTKEIPVSGVFIAAGQQPVSGIFGGIVKLSESGIVETDSRFRTSEPGIFAAGDVADSVYRQAVISAASGAAAALETVRFLQSYSPAK